VTFYLFKERSAEADPNMAKVLEMGLPVIIFDHDQRYRVLRTRIHVTDILIDALLGTGVSRPIKGELAKVMGQVQASLDERARLVAGKNRPDLIAITSLENNIPGGMDQEIIAGKSDRNTPTSNPIIVAIDCPSGLNCDTGELDVLALPAALTITFAGPKRGHFLFPGATACGEIVVADIGIGSDLPEITEVPVELATAEMVRTFLPERRRDGHKGTFGWVLIAAGSARYWGAPALAGRAAYRSGAGLVALAVPAQIRPALAILLPEATFPIVAGDDLLTEQSALTLFEEMKSYEALLIGPGLHTALTFMETLFDSPQDALPPMVIDADGLNLLAGMPNWADRLPSNTVLTPHAGEMARLMGVSLETMRTRDRIELAREKAAEWGCTVLLKGAFTVIAGADGRCALLPFANPALATAGSGDVLSGVILSLLGQGVLPFEAAVLGGFLHAAAAELSGVDAGLLATEIADWVAEALDTLRR
jgi:NAD(P)H-hydrate epimerase